MFGNSKIDLSTTFRWSERLRLGTDSTDDKKRSGRPKTSTSNTSVAILTTILESRIPKSSVHRVLSGVLETRTVAARSTTTQRPHIAHTIKNFTHYKWEALPHPGYRPNTRPPDSGLLPNLKEPVSGQGFHSSKTMTATET